MLKARRILLFAFTALFAHGASHAHTDRIGERPIAVAKPHGHVLGGAYRKIELVVAVEVVWDTTVKGIELIVIRGYNYLSAKLIFYAFLFTKIN